MVGVEMPRLIPLVVVAFLGCSGVTVPDRAERARLAVAGARAACQELFRTPPQTIPAEVIIACEALLGDEPADGGGAAQ
jgi:hypothetical protein